MDALTHLDESGRAKMVDVGHKPIAAREAKAEGYIGNGYQRLLTFEVPGGGFSWFGQAPANKILTAYGLMEFSDMAKVYDVDPRLIEQALRRGGPAQHTYPYAESFDHIETKKGQEPFAPAHCSRNA